MSGVDDWLDEIDAALARGVDVTTEMFPWTSGSAAISSDVFSRNWREIFAIDYTDVQWAETGEWLTEETFQAYRETRPDGQTMHHYIREEWNRLAIQRPHVMVASDAMPLLSYDRKVVPNGAGTSARILGQYVRDEGLLSLSDAIARLSLYPAQRMEAIAPAFARKGRVSIGVDADIVVFDPGTVAAEARRLVATGTRELTLLGQNVNAYHGEAADGASWSLARLIRELAEIDGLDRIRYTTSHPLDMEDDLITAHRDVPSLMPYLHLPVQAGSDRILAAMNRRHTHDVYLRILDKLRAAREDIAFSGDFIVGFPGESDRDFADTLALVDRVGYASAYSFKYSPRPGTPAAASEEQVPEDVKSDRLEALQQVINAQQFAFNKQTEGRTLDVLVERAGGRHGQMAGRSPYMQAVNLTGDESMIGRILPCRITEARQNSVIGAAA